MNRFLVLVCLVLGTVSWLRPAYANSDAFSTYGDVGAVGIPVVAGIISLAKKDYEGIKQLGLGYGVSVGSTYALKYMIDAERPNGGRHSFPSGHTASAFAGASYLHYRYGWDYGIPAYVAASAVALSRIDADEHHWRDVIASTVLANAVAWFLTDKYESKVAVLPVVDPDNGTYGITAALRF